MKKLMIPALLCSSFLITGCSSLLGPVKQKPLTYYEIVDRSIGKTANCPTSSAPKSVIYVSPMKTTSFFNSGKMYYSTKPNEISAFAYSQWMTTPNEMLQQTMMTTILATCAYNLANLNSLVTGANYQLATKLINMRQNIINSDHAEVVLEIFAELIDLEQNSVIANKRFVETSTSPLGPQAMAEQLNQLTTIFNNELVTWLKSITTN